MFGTGSSHDPTHRTYSARHEQDAATICSISLKQAGEVDGEYLLTVSQLSRELSKYSDGHLAEDAASSLFFQEVLPRIRGKQVGLPPQLAELQAKVLAKFVSARLELYVAHERLREALKAERTLTMPEAAS